MFVVLLRYKMPLAIVDQHLASHRSYLAGNYQNNCFIASGPRNPRDGGVLISQLKNKQQLEQIISNDPFFIHDIADYEIIEFDPVKYHEGFAPFVITP